MCATPDVAVRRTLERDDLLDQLALLDLQMVAVRHQPAEPSQLLKAHQSSPISSASGSEAGSLP